jgi:large subunit ribosomal protein L25
MLKLQAQNRIIFGKKIESLLREGYIPAEIYGNKFENKHIQVVRKDFEKAFKEAGETGVITLEVENTSYPVLVHHLSYNQLGDTVRAIDFYAVNLKEKTQAEIPIRLIGESPAVKELSGILVKALEKIEVEALPTDLPPHIDIDISVIKELNQSIYIKDIVLSGKVKILDDPDTVVAVVTEQRAEKEEPVAPVVDNEEGAKNEVKEGEKDSQGTAKG